MTENSDPASAKNIARYFAEGALRVEVDAPKPAGFYNTAYVGEKYVPLDAPTQLVHVIFLGGEIRGYMLIENRLHLRLPAYTGEWPAMDEAVAKLTGATILPYKRIGGGGMEFTCG